MDNGPSLDPDEILGVGREATVEAIREAFRVRSLKHHPDRGGDAWAFRVVQWAYQTRLARAACEAAQRPAPPPAAPPPSPTPPAPPSRSRWELPRPGVCDRALDPTQLVEVELLRILREADIPMGGLGLLGEDRSLGARLTVGWPGRDVPDDPQTIPHADLALRALAAVFEEARERQGVTGAQVQQDSGRFAAWLSYNSATAANKALRHLHVGLRARGLGMNQWTRIHAVPATERRN